MKITNYYANEIRKVLEDIGSREVEDAALAFKIAKNSYKITMALSPAEKVRNDLLKKYGKKDKNGKLIADSAGNVNITDVKKYNQEYIALMNIENDIDIDLFKEEDFKKMKATPNQMLKLMAVSELK